MHTYVPANVNPLKEGPLLFPHHHIPGTRSRALHTAGAHQRAWEGMAAPLAMCRRTAWGKLAEPLRASVSSPRKHDNCTSLSYKHIDTCKTLRTVRSTQTCQLMLALVTVVTKTCVNWIFYLNNGILCPAIAGVQRWDTIELAARSCRREVWGRLLATHSTNSMVCSLLFLLL